MWGVVSEVTGLSLTLSQWLSSGLEVKKYNPVNVFYTAAVWALWKFQGQCWEGRNEESDGKLREAAAKLGPGQQLRR
jgi:hypothetical protein